MFVLELRLAQKKEACGSAAGRDCWGTYLLHDTGLALGEGNVTTRLILDKLDFNLATLATGLVVVVVVVASSAHATALAVDGTVARLLQVVLRRRGVLVGDNGGEIGHGEIF